MPLIRRMRILGTSKGFYSRRLAAYAFQGAALPRASRPRRRCDQGGVGGDRAVAVSLTIACYGVSVLLNWARSRCRRA